MILKGCDRHSFWPDSGRCLSEAVHRLDIETMKDMNMNAVRMSHYPPDAQFLDLCDELGLYVLDELAGWHHFYDNEVGTKLVQRNGHARRESSVHFILGQRQRRRLQHQPRQTFRRTRSAAAPRAASVGAVQRREHRALSRLTTRPKSRRRPARLSTPKIDELVATRTIRRNIFTCPRNFCTAFTTAARARAWTITGA